MKINLPFNTNDRVLVKLLPRGLAELERQREDLRSMFPKVEPYVAPAVDENGYSAFQLWRLMEELGPLCGLARPMPFETTIQIPLEVEESGDIKAHFATQRLKDENRELRHKISMALNNMLDLKALLEDDDYEGALLHVKECLGEES